MTFRNASLFGLVLSTLLAACADPGQMSVPDVRTDADAGPCEDGVVEGSCSTACPDFRRVTGVRICQDGRFVCRAPAQSCTSVPSDAGTADSAVATDVPDTTDAGPVTSAPALSVQAAAISGPVYAGRNFVRLFMGNAVARRDVETRELRVRIEAIGYRLNNGSGVSPLRNIRLVDEETGANVFETSVVTFSSPTNAREINARFSGVVRKRAGQRLSFSLAADIDAVAGMEMAGLRFRVVIDDGAGHFFNEGDVRDANTGMAIPADAIEGNEAFVGETRELRAPNLSVRVSSGALVEQTVVRNTSNVYAIPLSLVSGTDRPLPVNEFTATGVADLGSGFNRAAFGRAVTRCAVFSAPARQHGVWMVPDTYGRMTFTGLGLTVMPRATQELYLVCGTTGAIENPSGTNRFAVTIADDTDVRVDDGSGGDPGVVVEARLREQVYAPRFIVNVRRAGQVSMESEAIARRQYAGGTGEWILINRYQFASTFEESAIPRLALEVHGNVACISELGIARNSGEMLATARLSAGLAMVDVPLTGFSFTAPDSLVIFAQINRPVSPEADPRGCHAGDVVSVTIARNVVDGEWDASFLGRYNLRILGSISGELQTIAAPSDFVPFRDASSFTVR